MKAKVKVFGKAVLAAVTSPTVVKLEEKVAVFVVVRVATSLGASAAFIAGIYEIAHKLGAV